MCFVLHKYFVFGADRCNLVLLAPLAEIGLQLLLHTVAITTSVAQAWTDTQKHIAPQQYGGRC